jgi:hypothetical protein
MDLDKYNYTPGESDLEYEFISNGPKGSITKVVRYTQFKHDKTIFNLGLGDKNEVTGFVDGSAISNNNDRDKVLATVASTVLDFMLRYPDCSIFIKGITPSRTRLYQMGISANFEELNKQFHISGFINGKWESFRKIVNYEAFLVEN